MAVQQLRSVYQIKVTLNYVEPPVWRRILVLNTMSLPKFHSAIQIAMGWTDCHLHIFMTSKGHYGLPDDEFGDGNTIDESGFKVSDLMAVEGDSIMYEYDFGDGWLHKVVLEKLLDDTPEEKVWKAQQKTEDEQRRKNQSFWQEIMGVKI